MNVASLVPPTDTTFIPVDVCAPVPPTLATFIAVAPDALPVIAKLSVIDESFP